MNNKISLFHFQTSEINIDIEVYFEDEKLIIEGYDIGKRVEACWGDSDYEYSTIIFPEEVKKLYPLFEVKDGDKWALLEAIAKKYNSNFCYSEFGDFLMKNNIKADGFSWT